MPVELDPGWPRLRRSLDLADGVALYLVFIDWPAQVDLGCRYLDDSLRLRTLRLQRVVPALSGELVSVAMDALLGGDCGPGRPVWLECWRHPGGDGWSEARRQLLARLNEGRGRLESTFRAPLVLLLPCDDVARTAEIAPDVWSVRRLTLRCERPRLEPAAAGATRIESKPARDRRLAELVELAERRLAAWQRQSAGAGKANLADSWAAVESLREPGRLPEARRIAGESLELSRQLRTALGDTPQAVQDLAGRFDIVYGTLLAKQGDASAARALAQGLNERRPAARQAQQLLATIDTALAAIG